jgi:hypothetical protein
MQKVKWAGFKKILMFMKDKDSIVNDPNVKVLSEKKLFQIDQLFFVIFVKNNQLFN